MLWPNEEQPRWKKLQYKLSFHPTRIHENWYEKSQKSQKKKKTVAKSEKQFRDIL